MKNSSQIATDTRAQTVCLFILSTIGIAFALAWLKPVMIPFILALFFTLALTPIIDFQTRYLYLSHRLATLTTLACGFLMLTLFWLIISTSISQLMSNIDNYQQQIFDLLQAVAKTLHLDKENLLPSIQQSIKIDF
ncbi:MAG: AI-2E family transporter, partial [Verrucomicrobia bacterium]|nr:AI-2E family transporter [Verrucomicrobiota bacterium]